MYVVFLRLLRNSSSPFQVTAEVLLCTSRSEHLLNNLRFFFLTLLSLTSLIGITPKPQNMALVPSAPLGPEAMHLTNPSTWLDALKNSVDVEVSNSIEQDNEDKKQHLLVVSPYDEEPHLLDLRTLNAANRKLLGR